MIHRPTLHVLAEASEIGLLEAATVPARPFDPLLRPFIRKNVRRAVDAASARTTSKNGDHVLRLAFLACHEQGPRDLDPDDERAVAAAFKTLAAPYLPPTADDPAPLPRGHAYRATAAERTPTTDAEPAPRVRRRWPVTVPVAIFMLVATLATVALLVVPRLLPSPSARFRKTPFGQALGDPLTDTVVASGRGRIDQAARAKLLSPDVKKQIGSDAFNALEHVVDELPRAVGYREESIDKSLAPLFGNVNELDAKLAAAKVPAHVRAYGSGASGAMVWLTSYFVEQRDELVLDGVTVKFVRGRRLDGLNLTDANLYKANAEDWIVVSMDQVEKELVQTLLASLAHGAPLAPDESEAPGSPRVVMSQTAGRVIAAELVSATKISPADADALHRAIAQRNELAGSLVKVGYRYPATSSIELPAATVRRVIQSKKDYPRDAALLDDFLRMNDRAASYRRDVAPAVAVLTRLEEEEMAGAIVERKRLANVAVPRSATEDDDATPPLPLRTVATAATWLAILAREEQVPRLAFWRLVAPLFDAGSNDAPAVWTALTPLLARLELGSRDGIKTFDGTARGIAAILELPTQRVRDAAKATYEELFKRPPPTITCKNQP